jgi:hypothetical protein
MQVESALDDLNRQEEEINIKGDKYGFTRDENVGLEEIIEERKEIGYKIRRFTEEFQKKKNEPGEIKK